MQFNLFLFNKNLDYIVKQKKKEKKQKNYNI